MSLEPKPIALLVSRGSGYAYNVFLAHVDSRSDDVPRGRYCSLGLRLARRCPCRARLA